MILNLLVIVFVLGMAIMWSTYGLFSAFLHLLVVIVAGALAFAFWEPLVYNLLLGFMPSYAWGLGLVGLFAVLLIALRQLLDYYVRGNMKFPRLADQILGGLCGVASGILTTGIGVIGMGFLPLPPAIAGYQPYEVQSTGKVTPVEGGGLWIPVDTLTESFYNRVSAGAFSPWSGTSLAGWMPDVARQATVHRLAKFYDENQSLVASPETVEVTRLLTFDGEALPGVGGEVNDFINGNRSLAGKDAASQSSKRGGPAKRAPRRSTAIRCCASRRPRSASTCWTPTARASCWHRSAFPKPRSTATWSSTRSTTTSSTPRRSSPSR